ncbi:MAG: UbiA family prenyltransferase [Anaerolineae bacterium]|nr:UbiA family prenyltransferase [Anaerolineae bacterium]
MFSQKIRGLIGLFRPELPAAAGVCVLMGQVLAGGRVPPVPVAILGFLSVFTISASALILNDLFDYEVDRVNHPQRPLPSGRVTPRDVIVLTAITSLVGLGAALALGVDILAVGLLFWVIGFLYNWRFKESGLPGNLMVAVSVAFTFIFGAMTVQEPWNGLVWTFAGIAFLIDLGEEIAGDTMDMEGDKKRGTRSIPLLMGRRFALTLAIGLWSLVIPLSLVPVWMGWLGTTYLVIFLITDSLIVFFSYRLWRAPSPQAGRHAMRGVYMGMSLGVLAFLLGLWFG